jgi:hypothetical protein
MTEDDKPDRNADRIQTRIKAMLDKLRARFRQADEGQAPSVKAETDRGQNDA